jgi:hypothetical protein
MPATVTLVFTGQQQTLLARKNKKTFACSSQIETEFSWILTRVSRFALFPVNSKKSPCGVPEGASKQAISSVSKLHSSDSKL